MLTELSIRDFAIIEQVSVTFNEGLTVLTGETGAGKSIIIDAVQLLAGGRGSVEYVRHGAKRAEIEGLFTIDNKKHPIYKVGQEFGVDIQDNMVVLHRTITASGKSICRVNGKLVTLAILKEFGKTLVDIHSQHETQSLMEPRNHIELLDLYDVERIAPAKEEYQKLYGKYVELLDHHRELNENEQEMSHRLDLLTFQIQELEQANLRPNEDQELEEERVQLANFEKIYMGIQDAYNALYGDQKGIEWLDKAQISLQENRNYDPFIAKQADKLTDYFYNIEELSFELRNFRDTLHYDGTRLDEIESRLHEIDRLKRKYGTTVNEMLEFLGEAEEELDKITNKDSHIDALEKEIDETRKDALLEAKHLHELRKHASDSLRKEIKKELKGLYLEKADFAVAFKDDLESIIDEKALKLHYNGFDQIHFMISTNPGVPLREISKVASGGELSRIMLIIKKIFARHQGVTSVIFDEVDTGVSGRVAQAMAEKIWQISTDSQVLCITHLPQVAAMADTHKLIKKTDQENRSVTEVTELTIDDTIVELSRMMTGAELTASALEHGRQLLDLAAEYKVEK